MTAGLLYLRNLNPLYLHVALDVEAEAVHGRAGDLLQGRDVVFAEQPRQRAQRSSSFERINCLDSAVNLAIGQVLG